jgi:hypothetical protein
VVFGGGRRHGGRLGLGCIVQPVRGLLVLVACLSFCADRVLISFYARRFMLAPFPPLTQQSFLVASPLLCAIRRWARRGAAGVVCGGGRRHGGRLGLGCIVQRVRGLLSVICVFVFLCLCFFLSFSARCVMMAPFLPFHS